MINTQSYKLQLYFTEETNNEYLKMIELSESKGKDSIEVKDAIINSIIQENLEKKQKFESLDSNLKILKTNVITMKYNFRMINYIKQFPTVYNNLHNFKL